MAEGYRDRIYNHNDAQKTISALERIGDTLLEISQKGATAEVLDGIVQAQVNGENTTRLFWAWYPHAHETETDKYALLCRFADAVSSAWGKTYTLRQYAESVSDLSTMTPLDDLAGKTGAPACTPADSDTDHWMDEDPMYWYIRANALSLANGKMNILCFEGEKDFDISGENAPVYTFKLSKWLKRWSDGQYEYKSWRLQKAEGYRPYAGDVDFEDNSKRPVTWMPTFDGALNAAGGLTSGAGKKIYNRHSANQGIVAARKTTAYEGLWTDCDTIALLDDWQFRHFDMENSGIMEGCLSYDVHHAVALAETGVKRVLVTPAQGASYIAGSNIQVGTHPEGTSTDRSAAANFDIADNATISSIENVTIGGTEYMALNLALDEAIDVPATAMIFSAPWNTGTTEKLPGRKDGSVMGLTSTKAPIRVGGVEVMTGAYVLGLDPLYQASAGSDADHFNYKVFECRNSENQTGSITANYEDTGIEIADVAKSWSYVRRFFETMKGVLIPDVFAGASNKRYKSAFFGTSSAGVRSPWRFGHLNAGANGGLACELGNHTPSGAYWDGCPRLSGAGKKRGEWPA